MWGEKKTFKGNGGLRAIREIEGYITPLFSHFQEKEGKKGREILIFSYPIEEEFQSESEIKGYQNIQT